MNLKRIAIAACVTLSCGVVVWADQAACLTEKDANKAAEVLRVAKQLREYCAPCDDTGWRKVDIETVDVVGGSCGTEVKVNGSGIDLAYVYVREDDKWVNLAKVVGVKVHDVPKVLPDDLPERDQ